MSALEEPCVERWPTTKSATARVLEGLRVVGSGGGLAVATCLRHLRDLGAEVDPAAATDHSVDRHGLSSKWVFVSPGRGHEREPWPVRADACCRISRPGPTHDDEEAVVQARCGLMEVHGRKTGAPARLGVEVASVATGVLATQGILACVLGQLRGGQDSAFETSVLQAGLLAVSQYIAAATSDEGCTSIERSGELVPPFLSGDGCRFEIETLDGDDWKAFWSALGVQGVEVGRAWSSFASRFATGACRLPGRLTAAFELRTFDEIVDVAASHGISICRIRTCEDAAAAMRREGRSQMPAPWKIEASAACSGLRPPARPLPRPGLPLEGVVVVESTRRLQGPLATHLLAELGAQVIRIEPPGGDPLRMIPPFAGDCSARFLALNGNKDVVEIDFKDPDGRRRIHELVAAADVFVHNWAPGKAEELGLDFDDFAPSDRPFVYSEISGWGDELGPRPPIGTDYMVQAHSGLAASLQPVGRESAPTLFTLTDVLGGMTATEGILAGLVLREREHRSCKVQTSLLSGAMVAQAQVLEDMVSARETRRRGGRPVWQALDHPLRTADGFLMVTVPTDGGLRELRRVCGIDDAESSGGEVVIAKRFQMRTTAEWQADLARVGINGVAVCCDLATLRSDPVVSPFLQDAAGCLVPRSPWRFQR